MAAFRHRILASPRSWCDVADVQRVQRVPDLLLPYIDRWTVQEPSLVDLQIVESMQEQMDAGLAWLFRHGDAYSFMRRMTPWVADMHLYNLGSAWGMVKSCRAITRHALGMFAKLEARTHDKRIGDMIVRCGWKQEAVYEHAFCTRDGQFLDEYGYGIWAKS